MDSSRNERWTSPFKKFNRLRVNNDDHGDNEDADSDDDNNDINFLGVTDKKIVLVSQW